MSLKKFFESVLEVDKNKKLYPGPVVDLKLRRIVSEDEAYDGVPTNYYEIYKHDTDEKVGSIDLRLKMDEVMYYYGHIGYNVIKKYRGNNYAYFACLILFKIARQEYDMEELYLTCNPDNIASYKTLKKLKGELIEVCQVPHDHEMYKLGDRVKCVFRYKIKI